MVWSMCMSAMCAMSCSGNMPLSVRFATMERYPWLAPLCLRGDKNNHREWARRPSEKTITEERRRHYLPARKWSPEPAHFIPAVIASSFNHR